MVVMTVASGPAGGWPGVGHARVEAASVSGPRVTRACVEPCVAASIVNAGVLEQACVFGATVAPARVFRSARVHHETCVGEACVHRRACIEARVTRAFVDDRRAGIGRGRSETRGGHAAKRTRTQRCLIVGENCNERADVCLGGSSFPRLRFLSFRASSASAMADLSARAFSGSHRFSMFITGPGPRIAPAVMSPPSAPPATPHVARSAPVSINPGSGVFACSGSS